MTRLSILNGIPTIIIILLAVYYLFIFNGILLDSIGLKDNSYKSSIQMIISNIYF
jgi:hypothetical protein